MIALLPKTVLFGCSSDTLEDKVESPYTFDYDFKLRGNFTFTYLLAVNMVFYFSKLMINYFF